MSLFCRSAADRGEGLEAVSWGANVIPELIGQFASSSRNAMAVNSNPTLGANKFPQHRPRTQPTRHTTNERMALIGRVGVLHSKFLAV